MSAKSAVLTIALCLVVALPACAPAGFSASQINVLSGSGRVVTQARPVSGYTAVTLEGEGNVIITRGEAEGITIEADDNFLPLITTEVRDGTLVIGIDQTSGRQSFKATKPIVYHVNIKSVDALTLAGAGTVTAENLAADRLAVSVLGAGDVKVAGEVQGLAVAISGTGHIDAGGLKTAVSDVALNGAGHITVWATERLTASVTAAGSIRYYGSPKVTQSVKVAGELTALGVK